MNRDGSFNEPTSGGSSILDVNVTAIREWSAALIAAGYTPSEACIERIKSGLMDGRCYPTRVERYTLDGVTIYGLRSGSAYESWTWRKLFSTEAKAIRHVIEMIKRGES